MLSKKENNINMICKDLFFCFVGKQEFEQGNRFFKKLPFSQEYFSMKKI